MYALITEKNFEMVKKFSSEFLSELYVNVGLHFFNLPTVSHFILVLCLSAQFILDLWISVKLKFNRQPFTTF